MLTHALVPCDEIYAAFDAMRIKHPYHENAVTVFEKLRKRMLSAPHAEQTAGSLFAGSNSGKTTTVKWYIEKVIVPEWIRLRAPNAVGPLNELSKLQDVALHVELSGATTESGLMSDFLESIGDPDPHGGTVKQRRYRVERHLQRYQIVFLDESQHIKTQTHAGPINRREDATVVQNTLKRWVKRLPIIFVGTQHAQNVVFEHQVETRSDPPIEFGPLHFSRPGDVKISTEFCGRLILKIVEHRILESRPMILIEGDVPLCLNIASKGRLGLITKIVRMALEIAVGSGVRELRREHLQMAVEHFTLRIGVCSYNPFTAGPNLMPSLEEYANDKT